MASSIPGLGKVLRRPPFQGRPEKPLTNPGTKVVPRDGNREVEQGFCYIVGGVITAPWDAPLVTGNNRPSSRTPARSHFPINLTRLLSLIRR